MVCHCFKSSSSLRGLLALAFLQSLLSHWQSRHFFNFFTLLIYFVANLSQLKLAPFPFLLVLGPLWVEADAFVLGEIFSPHLAKVRRHFLVMLQEERFCLGDLQQPHLMASLSSSLLEEMKLGIRRGLGKCKVRCIDCNEWRRLGSAPCKETSQLRRAIFSILHFFALLQWRRGFTHGFSTLEVWLLRSG